jgi:dual specificity protein kinase YAK1
MSLLRLSTISLREIYNAINYDLYPAPVHEIGRPLNPPEDEEADPDSPESPDGHRIVSVNELLRNPNGGSYRVIDLLGFGTYSYVMKCEDLSCPGRFVAVKVLKNLPQYHATGCNEILIHKRLAETPPRLGRDGVAHPLTTFEINRHICLVLPLLSRSLFEGLPQTQRPLELLGMIRPILREVLETLSFLHANGVIHCDVKPDNILFCGDAGDHVRIVDFGSAITEIGTSQQYIQSRFYRSFEVMIGLPVGFPIDIWSAGCIAAELFLDFAIFACESETDSVPCIVAMLGAVPDSLLTVSTSWRKFFDMGAKGFTLKCDPLEALTKRHLYHENIAEHGATTLRQLILGKFKCSGQEEKMAVNAFCDLVHALLSYDPAVRPAAEVALKHPFITGEKFTGKWVPPAKVERGPGRAAAAAPAAAPATAVDFLSMM